MLRQKARIATPEILGLPLRATVRVDGMVAAASAPLAKPPTSKLRIAGIAGAAVGVGLAAGAAFGLATKSRHDDAMKALSDRRQAESLQSEAKDVVTAANVSLIAGGALVALGVAAIIVGTPDQARDSAGVHAYLLPSVGLGSAGLAAGGTW